LRVFAYDPGLTPGTGLVQSAPFVRFSTIIRPNGREDDFQNGYPCALGARLILRNLPRSRPLCVQDFGPSWLVRMLANIQQLAKIPLTHLATPAELGGKRGTIKGSKAPRLFRQRGFELP
jgi:hypothetical protein